jgi:hypothetical protein
MQQPAAAMVGADDRGLVLPPADAVADPEVAAAAAANAVIPPPLGILESLTASATAANVVLPDDLFTPVLITAIRRFERQQREARVQRWDNFNTATKTLWDSTNNGLYRIQESLQQCCYQLQDEMVQMIVKYRFMERQERVLDDNDLAAGATVWRRRHFVSLIAMIHRVQKMQDDSAVHQAKLQRQCQENIDTLRNRIVELDQRDVISNRDLVDVMMNLLTAAPPPMMPLLPDHSNANNNEPRHHDDDNDAVVLLEHV